MGKIKITKILKEFPKRYISDLFYNYTHNEIDDNIHYIEETSKDNCTINVFIQNIWGLPVIASDLIERVDKLASVIRTKKYDIIVIVELWSQRERDVIYNAAKDADMHYHHYFSPGIGFIMFPLIAGTGILILSKYPIIETLYRRFAVNGDPYMIHHADFYGAKGCGLARIKTCCGIIDLFVTHPQASYTDKRTDYLSCRVAQAFELAQFVRIASKSSFVILAGDFNSCPNEITHRILKEIVPTIKDSWLEANKGLF